MRAILLLLVFAGCGTLIGVKKRTKEDWFAEAQRSILTSNDVSEVTFNILRRRDLHENYKQDPLLPIALLQQEMAETKRRDLAVAIAELGYLQAKRWTNLERRALMTTIRYSYAYLFDSKLEPAPQKFDAQFRWACDLHMVALADMIRESRREGRSDDASAPVEWYGGQTTIRVGRNEMSWGLDQYDELHVAADFRVEGLPSPDSRRGFGVPCILRRRWNRDALQESFDAARFRYLPENLAFAATVIVRFPDGTSVLDEKQPDLLIEVLDPTQTVSVDIEGVRVPLEIDYITPIASILTGQEQRIGLSALFRGNEYERKGGLYMFQPYQENKILVLFVHGLASDPLTWLHLYTDLLANDTVRTRCQFAFWFYPTGQPAFYSAQQLRVALAQTNELMDPEERDPIDKHTIVCGHSMGGILTRSLVTDSGTALWDQVFDKQPEELDLPPEDRQLVKEVLIFEPLPFVSRVIFYATPHRGAPMARRGLAEWASGLLELPGRIADPNRRVLREAKPQYRNYARLTSVQSLRDDNPVLLAMADLPVAKGVIYHSIIGDTRQAGNTGGSDGIVPYSSSHLPGAESELIVHSGHSVQHTPQAARETRRILLEHIAEFDARHGK
ncbi:MAG: esterase/lipase family protein [Planctomycetota bacterium]|jgi:pimeloyl-ACP methyl ester carboxylesterase